MPAFDVVDGPIAWESPSWTGFYKRHPTRFRFADPPPRKIIFQGCIGPYFGGCYQRRQLTTNDVTGEVMAF
jgi:hypothetical protein